MGQVTDENLPILIKKVNQNDGDRVTVQLHGV
jgi:hypothetical protein